MKFRIKNKDIEIEWLKSGWTKIYRFFHLTPTILFHRDCRYHYGGILFAWLYWGFEIKWQNHN